MINLLTNIRSIFFYINIKISVKFYKKLKYYLFDIPSNAS